MNEAQKFRRLALRVKVVRWLVTVVIVIVVVLVGAIGGYGWTQHQAAKESDELTQYMSGLSTVMSPNIETSDQYLADTNFMGGKVTSHRYKDIEGYRESWSPLVEPYSWSWLGTQSATMTLNATDTTNTGAYDRLTQHKVPLFYNPRVKHPDVKRATDVTKVAATKGAVAEVALTFKHPLTYAQIQRQLPRKLHAVWYWIGTGAKADPTMMDNTFMGVQANSQGHLQQGKYTHPYRDFRQAAKQLQKMTWDAQYDGFSPAKYLKSYVTRYPTQKTAKFAGVIVTGNSENFQPLTQANWFYASSAGFFQARTAIK